MSGHSKWANIKHRKDSQDAKKAKVFSKLSRLITLAARKGKSSDPGLNPALQQAIGRAKKESMPKDNIERAIANAEKSTSEMKEFLLEGYGPSGIAVLIEALSDNRQRTVQEMKSFFDRSGGSLAEPGAVVYQFERRGLVLLDQEVSEEGMLKLIDLGADDLEKERNQVLIWLSPDNLEEFRSKAGENGFAIATGRLVYRPKMVTELRNGTKRQEIKEFLGILNDHDDVQGVYTNLKGF